MSEMSLDIISQKKIELLNNYLDKIMKSTGSQFGYIHKVETRENVSQLSPLVQMYYMQDVMVNLSIDTEFNFLEDIKSTLEFYNQQVISHGKPMIINDYNLSSNAFTLDNTSITHESAWFIIPVHHYDEAVAIIGLIGSPIRFNVLYYEMFQPFMILCSELIASIM
ncbi:MAG: hypothetical protein ACW99A_13505 [Candidatus Kariarchaeaceae archaeon]|jgi:hypothetical protein